MQDTYNKRCHWYKLCRHNSLWDTAILFLFSYKRKSCFGEIWRLPVSNILHNFWCPEHNVTSFRKYVCAYLSEKFVESVNQKLTGLYETLHFGVPWY